MSDCTLSPFDRLDGRTVHDVLRLRGEIFVVEQACPYPDIDGRDTSPGTRHAIARDAGRLVACARSLAPTTGQDARIGRVAVAASHRRRGLAHQLLSMLLADLAARLPDSGVRLDAQLEAEALYAGLDFTRIGEPFLEDGIAHVVMRRPPPARSPAAKA